MCVIAEDENQCAFFFFAVVSTSVLDSFFFLVLFPSTLGFSPDSGCCLPYT